MAFKTVKLHHAFEFPLMILGLIEDFLFGLLVLLVIMGLTGIALNRI